jgi:hypothetical protein
MNSYSERHDDPKFSKKIRRDAVILVIIFVLSWVGLFLTPLIAYMGHKYGW